MGETVINGIAGLIMIVIYIIFLPVLYDFLSNGSEFFVEATLYLKGK